MELNSLKDLFRGKRVLFVTTKQLSYIRNTQEIELLRTAASEVLLGGKESKNYFVRVLCAALASFRAVSRKAQIVFVGFAPQLMLPFFWLYRLRGRTLVIDFFISLYDTFVCDRKVFGPRSFAARLLHRLDRATLKGADYFVADTKAHLNYFVEEFGADPNKGCVLYLQADTEIYHPMPQQKEAADRSRYLVLYFGSVLPLQGTPVILEAMRLLRDHPEIHFVFIGPVDKKQKLDHSEYPNTTFISWLSQPELAQKIAQADLCLAGHFSAQIAKASRTIAGKSYIYRAMERPMILGENAANRELFSEQEGEIEFVPMGDAEALAKKIISMQEKWSAQGGDAARKESR